MVAKICGADVELGNFVTGSVRAVPGAVASALLAAIPGVPQRSPFFARSSSVQRETDRDRKFLASNGGCAYIDLNHLEICLPEVRSARDHTACWLAMLRVVRAAQAAVSAANPGGNVHVLANNSDGLGSSYGSHLDFLVTRRAWEDMFNQKLHPLLFLAAYQASSIVITGQGKVGSENGAPDVPFQLSQRADFIETLVGPQTTFCRPLVNSRDEALCGTAGDAQQDLARLHVICYDSNLCPTAHFLKVGVLQIVLAMIEAGATSPVLLLDNPVRAVRAWSHDASLRHQEPLVTGRLVSAVELQRLFVEDARAFVQSGVLREIVPDAHEILTLWDDTVAKLESGDLETLARRLDWVLKASLLRSVADDRHLEWPSAELKHLDHLFASLDPADGLFWGCERAGLVDGVVTESEIDYFTSNPPADTRAWTRTMLLRDEGPTGIAEVDWDFVRIRDGWDTVRIDLADPREHTREAHQTRFEEGERYEVS